jgi:CDGSH-type Zn-finger protein
VTASVRVQSCPRGPLLVRGAEVVLDDEGVAHDVRRPVVALCTCGMSARKPWCDATHKSIPDDAR